MNETFPTVGLIIVAIILFLIGAYYITINYVKQKKDSELQRELEQRKIKLKNNINKSKNLAKKRKIKLKNNINKSKNLAKNKKENEKNETLTDKFVKNEALTASDHWDQAIVAAENSRREEALRKFGIAIEMNPNRFVSEIEPQSTNAYAVWVDAVQEYVSKKDESASASLSTENTCQRCGKDVGTDWRYGFEGISYGATVGKMCPDCGLILCRDHIKVDNKELNACPNCQTAFVRMQEGSAASSCVDKARSECRYRGPIQEPSFHGRPMHEG